MNYILPLVTNLYGIKIPSQTTLATQPILNETSRVEEVRVGHSLPLPYGLKQGGERGGSNYKII
jgi:hypothetical protein